MLIRSLKDAAEYLGAAWPTNESLSRRVYKDSECGCWAKVEGDEFMVGSIIEGEDAEAPVIRVALPCEGADLDDAITEVEISVEHYLVHGTFY